jgi:hypothetical protein
LICGSETLLIALAYTSSLDLAFSSQNKLLSHGYKIVLCSETPGDTEGNKGFEDHDATPSAIVKTPVG